MPAQVSSSAVEVSGFNPPRSTGCRSAHRAAAASACTSPLRQHAKASSRRGRALVCPRRRLGAAAELLLGCSSWARWEAAIAAGPGLPSSTAGRQNNPAAGTELLAVVWARGAAMGSVLSSDSGKSAPASAAPRALERKGDPELPVTSFDCSVCLEVLHQPVRTRCGHV